MPREGNHIINKVFVEVNAQSNKEAFKLKDDMAVFFQYQVFPEIEEYFNQVSRVYPNSTVQFNRLELQLDNINLKNRSSAINQIVGQLKKEVDKKLKKNGPQKSENKSIISLRENELEAVFFFLKTGLKPWWQPNLSNILNENNIKNWVSEQSFSVRFQKALHNNVVKERLVSQFDDDTLMLFLKMPDESRKKLSRKLLGSFKNDVAFRKTFWTSVLTFFQTKNLEILKASLKSIFGKTKDSEWLISIINTITGASFKITDFTQGGNDDSVFKPTSDTEPSEDDQQKEDDGLYIDNAGLVLLHPFFKPFFINAKLADGKGKLIESKIETAIHILHYMSTKNEQSLESELVLEKFLCGYPIHKPIARFVPLSTEIKKLAEAVLQSAIAHWEVLKSTSADGLRTTFLQREGKLILNGNAKIVVERKTQDVLLDKIPWNIHLIKLPWFDKIVFVEW